MPRQFPARQEPRELTQEEIEGRALQAHELERAVKTYASQGREAMWKMARALYEFDEAEGWSALGGYEDLDDWLADPEIQLERKTYKRLVTAWRNLVVIGKVKPERLLTVDVSKVEVILPAVRAGRKTLKEALADAQALGWHDLREVYQGGNVPAQGNEQADDGDVIEGTATPVYETVGDEARALVATWRFETQGPIETYKRAKVRDAGDALAEFVAREFVA